MLFKITFALVMGVLLLYLLTLPNSNPNFADSDELITAAKVLGIPHPPGYPLYTMLAAISGYLPVPFLTFAGKVNLLSALLHSLTVGCFFLISFLLLDNQIKDWKVKVAASITSALAVGAAYNFWFHSLIAEVFSLNSFLTSLTVLLLIYWQKVSKDKWLILSGLFYGLTLSNQQASLLLSPVLLFWVLINWKKINSKVKSLSFSLSLLAVGFLTPYLYPFLTSFREPFLNWENPNNLYQLFRLITRRVYADVSSSGAGYVTFSQIRPEFFFLNIFKFFEYIIDNFGVIFTLIGLLGLTALFRRREWRITVFILGAIFFTGLFFSLYDPTKWETVNSADFNISLLIQRRFYILSLFFFGLLISFGSAFLLSAQRYKNVILTGLLVLTLFFITTNFKDIKLNDFNLASGYSKAVLDTVEKNGILICFTAEEGCFSSYYLQEVEGKRKDIIVVPGDFRQRTIPQLEKQANEDLIKTISPDQLALVRDLIRWNINKRAIYFIGINPRIELLSIFNVDGNPYYLTPKGCGLYQVTKTYNHERVENKCEDLEKRILSSQDSPKNYYRQMYAPFFAYHHYYNAVIYVSHGCGKETLSEMEKALKLYPRYDQANKERAKLTSAGIDDKNCPARTEEVKIGQLNAAAKKGSLEEQIYLTFQASMIDPANLTIRENLAQLYQKGGYNQLALIEYQDILILDPDNKAAKKALGL